MSFWLTLIVLGALVVVLGFKFLKLALTLAIAILVVALAYPKLSKVDWKGEAKKVQTFVSKVRQ